MVANSVEIIVQLVPEFTILVFGILLAALSFAVPDKKPSSSLNQFLVLPLYLVRGIAVGTTIALISLWLAPKPFITLKPLAISYLFVIPFLGGFMMAIAMESKLVLGKRFVRVNTFLFGFAFALTLAMIRYFFAK